MILLRVLVMFFAFIMNGCADYTEYKKHKIEAIHLYVIENAIYKFKHDVGRFPSIEEGLTSLAMKPVDVNNWNGPYRDYKDIDVWGEYDTWGTKYIYLYPAVYGNSDFDLYSCGKNKQNDYGQGDDITNWGGVKDEYYNK